MRKALMEQAKSYALINPVDKTPMAAVLAKGSKVLSIGFNKYEAHNELKAHPDVKQPDHCKGIHAETAAIKPLQFQNLKGAHMYVARARADGTFGMAAPCETCLKHLIQKGIKRVYFTNGIGGVGVIKL